MLPFFRRLILSAVVAGLVVPGVPFFAAPAAAGPLTGAILGSARSASGQAMPNITVRLRSMQTGQLAGVTRAGSDGQFSFAALGAGSYIVEGVNAAGAIVSTSAAVLLTTRVMVATGVTARAWAAAEQAGAGTGGGGSFLTSTAGIITIAAVGAGVVTVLAVATREDASPSN